MGQSSSKNDPPVKPKRFYPSLDPFDAAPWPPDLQPRSLAEGPPARPPSTNPFIQPSAPTPPPPYCPPLQSIPPLSPPVVLSSLLMLTQEATVQLHGTHGSLGTLRSSKRQCWRMGPTPPGQKPSSEVWPIPHVRRLTGGH